MGKANDLWNTRAEDAKTKAAIGYPEDLQADAAELVKCVNMKVDAYVMQHEAMRKAIMRILDDSGVYRGGEISQFSIDQALEAVNAHYCPDLDYLPICPENPGWEACRCVVKQEIEHAKRQG